MLDLIYPEIRNLSLSMMCCLQGGHLDRSRYGPIQDAFVWGRLECIPLIVYHILGRRLFQVVRECHMYVRNKKKSEMGLKREVDLYIPMAAQQAF